MFACILYPQFFGIPDSVTAIKISFITVSIWVVIFTIPIMLFVPEPKNSNSVPFKMAFFEAYKRTQNYL